MLAPICSAPAATVCTFRDTSSAAPATTPDWAEVSSADAEICAELALSSSDEAATASADDATAVRTSRRLSWAVPSAADIRPSSSWLRTSARTVRSPAASASTDACTERTVPTSRRTTRTVNAPASRMPTVRDTHRVRTRSEEHTSELQSRQYLVCRLLLEKKKKFTTSLSRYTTDEHT